MSLNSTYYYRVCDGVSNPMNLLTDYVTRQEHNIIYKSYKQATIIANERMKQRLGLAYDATIRGVPELIFTEENKADCEANGHYLRIFPLHVGVECFVAIIPIKSYKPPMTQPKRRSARVAAMAPVHYNEADDEDESDSEQFMPLPVEAAAAPRIYDVVDLTDADADAEAEEEEFPRIGDLRIEPEIPPSVIPKRLLGGAMEDDGDDDPI